MASSAAIQQGQQSPPPSKSRIVRLWKDTVRVEQMARLRSLELQNEQKFGERAWELAYEQWRQIPDDIRIDLPSPHVFSAILGVFRTGATLKTGKLIRLEISATELGELTGYSKATIEAALRWLGTARIEINGEVFGHGLQLIHSGRRTAWAYLEGQLRRVYRTARRVLTNLGRLMLGLGQRDVERQKEKRIARRERRGEGKKPPPHSPPPRREKEYVEGEAPFDDSGGEVAAQYLKQIKDDLGIK